MIAAARTREFEVTNRISQACSVDTPQRPEPASPANPAPKKAEPLAAAKRAFTAGIHIAVLVGIVTFVVLQLSLAATSDSRKTIVKVVAASNEPLTAPFDGVFEAATDLHKGARVRAGQLLGHIKSVAQNDEIHVLREKISDLRKQRVMLRTAGQNSEAYSEVSQKLRLAKVELESLYNAAKRQDVYSPVDGIIELGLAGSRPVKQHDSIAQVWETGSDLVIEVEGPINVLNKLLRKQTVNANFDTDQGSIEVAATPIEGSLKPMEKKDGKGTEIWGVIQCRPNAMPATLAAPGAMGHL